MLQEKYFAFPGQRNPYLIMDNHSDLAFSDELPRIENFEILDLIGRGGMSSVFKARQKGLSRLVAIKVLSNDSLVGPDELKRFQLEAKITSSLQHQNIVKVLSFGISRDGKAFIVMEFVKGRNLSAVLKEKGKLKLAEFEAIFMPVLSALSAAHNAGLVHRDIKPSNIMLSCDDDGLDSVKLVDFGIAKEIRVGSNSSLGVSLTATNVVIGSPVYMSPEQCSGMSIDARSDIYSISCVMFEALTGQPPFVGENSLELMFKHNNDAPPSALWLRKKAGISEKLALILLSGLAKDPSKRPQTVLEFAESLKSEIEKEKMQIFAGLLNQLSACFQDSKLLVSILALCVVFTALVLWQNKQSNIQAKTKVPSMAKIVSKQKLLAKKRWLHRFGEGRRNLEYDDPNAAIELFTKCIEESSDPSLHISNIELARAKTGLILAKCRLAQSTQAVKSLCGRDLLEMAVAAENELSKVKDSAGFDEDYFYALGCLGIVWEANGDAGKGEKFMGDALSYAEHYDNSMAVFISSNILAQWAEGRHHYAKAIELGSLSLNKACLCGIPEELPILARTKLSLAKCYHSLSAGKKSNQDMELHFLNDLVKYSKSADPELRKIADTSKALLKKRKRHSDSSSNRSNFV